MAMRRVVAHFRRLRGDFLRGPRWFPMPSAEEKGRRIPGCFMPLIWGYALLDRILTPQGRMLGAVYLAIAFYSTILTRSPAVILFFVLSGVLFFNLAAGFLFFPRVRIVRKVPERVSCGVEFRISYTLFNRSFLPCFDLAADPQLVMRNLQCTDGCVPRLTLLPKCEGTFSRGFRILKRGVYRLPCPLAETGFPFQLFKLSRTADQMQQIICQPAYTPLRTLRLPDGSAKNSESVNTVSAVGESMDFYGCREYRTGDDPRKIHWIASAKRGQFVIKEFQEEKLSRAALIMDNTLLAGRETVFGVLKKLFLLKPLRAGRDDAPFEAAVSLAASIAVSLSERDFVVDFFAAGSEVHHFRTGRNHMTKDGFLDLLASLKPTDGIGRFRRITPDDISGIASSGAVYLILLSVDSESEKLYRSLAETGVPLKTFLIAGKTGPAWAETLCTEDILNGKAGEL